MCYKCLECFPPLDIVSPNITCHLKFHVIVRIDTHIPCNQIEHEKLAQYRREKKKQVEVWIINDSVKASRGLDNRGSDYRCLTNLLFRALRLKLNHCRSSTSHIAGNDIALGYFVLPKRHGRFIYHF